MSGFFETTAFVVLSYLLGSIPSGLLLGRALTGQDVRETGSGNIGAANVSRMAGRPLAVAVLVADILKGLLPVLIARALHLDPIQLAVVAGAAVIGHDFSAFLRLHGGKGVATTFGACLALAPVPTAGAAALWVIFFAISRVSAIASLVSLWALPLLMAAFDQPPEYVALAFGLWLLALYTHRDNLKRLAQGSEYRFGAD
jgi:glycerol-3-phosphate acyltransferase PlsY